MTLNSNLVARMTDALSADVPPTATTKSDGRHVGRVYQPDFDGRDPVIAKVDDTPPNAEAAMLDSLTAAGLPVPAVYHADPDLLVLDYVEGTSELASAAEHDLAAHLATLHETIVPAFGFPYDTLSGSYRQPNPRTGSWIVFSRDQRFLPRTEAALGSGLPDATTRRIKSIATDLGGLLVKPTAPRLVHGDTWGMNLRVRDVRVAASLDPACCYDYLEVELAYINWLDTVGGALFGAYDERRPITDSFFEHRSPVCVLFPLPEHIRVLGIDYVPSVRDALDELGY